MAQLGYYILRFKEYGNDVINFLTKFNAGVISLPQTQSTVFIVPLQAVTTYDFAAIKVNYKENMESQFINGKEPDSGNVLAELQKLSTPQQQVNFLIFLLYKHFGVDKPEHAIFKKYLFTRIQDLMHTTNSEEFNEKLSKISQSLIITGDYTTARYRREFENLGMYSTKNQDPEVMLRNGTIIKFSQLQSYTTKIPSKYLEILHSIDISKINTDVDFSRYTVCGDFICNDPKADVKFPIQVCGTFSLTSYKSGSIEKIPNGATCINLTHSIQDFEQLNKMILPESVTKIIVAHSLLNAAKKDTNAKTFYASHKVITVIDEKGCTLQFVLQSMDSDQNSEKKRTSPSKPQITQINTPSIPQKSNDELTRSDLLQLLTNDNTFMEQLAVICPEFELKRLIYAATPSIQYPQKLLDPKQNILSVCVPDTDIPKVKQAILDNATKRAAHTQNKKAPGTTQQIENGPQQKTEKTRNVRKNISKYIPENVFKQIVKACGDDTTKLYTILSTVNQINIDYSNQELRAISHIDKGGKCTAIQDMETRAGRACTQRFPGVRDKGAKRIVWTIHGKTMVAIAFYEDHGDNDEAEYNKVALRQAQRGCLIDGTDISHINFNELDGAGKPKYLNVKDLLPIYKPREKAPQTIPTIVAVLTPVEDPLTETDLRGFSAFYQQIQKSIPSINSAMQRYIGQACADPYFVIEMYQNFGTICAMYNIKRPETPEIKPSAYGTETKIAGSRSGFSTDYRTVKRAERSIKTQYYKLNQCCNIYRNRYYDKYQTLNEQT